MSEKVKSVASKTAKLMKKSQDNNTRMTTQARRVEARGWIIIRVSKNDKIIVEDDYVYPSKRECEGIVQAIEHTTKGTYKAVKAQLVLEYNA